MKSVGFFTFYTFGTKFSLCMCNWLKDGKYDGKQKIFNLDLNLVYTIVTLIIVSGFSSFFESSSRITEYTIFTYPRIVEGIWDTLEKLKLVKAIPFARQLIFAFSLATALVIYKNKKEEMPNSYKKFITMVFGKNLFS